MTPNRKLLVDRAYRLFDRPEIYMAIGNGGYKTVLEVAQPSSVCLISVMAFLSVFGAVRCRLVAHQMKKQGIRVIICCNTAEDVILCRLLGMEAELINQNQFIIEDNIPLKPQEAEIRYDAFYAAQGHRVKRMHLASLIERLYILTYRCPRNEKGQDITLVEPSVGHADWNRNWMEFEEIAKIMHSAHCALALSRREGAMWAVVEAWMCGLPVVTTKSKGGRDRYYHRETTKIVKATPEAVREGVESVIAEGITPQRIRQTALEIIRRDRWKTVAKIQMRILAGYGFSDHEVYRRMFEDGPSRTPL